MKKADRPMFAPKFPFEIHSWSIVRDGVNLIESRLLPAAPSSCDSRIVIKVPDTCTHFGHFLDNAQHNPSGVRGRHGQIFKRRR